MGSGKMGKLHALRWYNGRHATRGIEGLGEGRGLGSIRLARRFRVWGGAQDASPPASAASSAPSPESASRITTTRGAGDAGPPTFDWPVAEGWKSETIPFPLDFATDIPYRGSEEIRFGPNFFDPRSKTYFTYAFAWVLDAAPPPTAKMLATDLTSYFSGLMQEVATQKHATYPVSSASVHVEGVDGLHYRGTVTTLDAFTDGHSVTLNMDAEWSTCRSHPVLLVSLSPHPVGDATWTDLMSKRAAFHCPSI